MKRTLVVELPRGRARVELSSQDRLNMDLEKALYISFYNMSGQLPIPDEFEPAAEWPDSERVRVFGMRPLAELRRRALTSSAGTIPLVECRLATGSLRKELREVYSYGRTGHDSIEVWSANVMMEKLGWVTHFAIGTKDRIFFSGQFDHPTPVMAGNGFSFGIKLRELMHPEVSEGPVPKYLKEYTCQACLDGECPAHLGTPSNLGNKIP